MTEFQAVSLFAQQMQNELNNAPIDEAAREYLLDALKETKEMVIETCRAESK